MVQILKDDVILLQGELNREKERNAMSSNKDKQSHKLEVEALHKKFAEFSEITEAESFVRDKVIEKILSEKKELEKKMRDMATILKVPRVHHAYIKDHGVDEFVDRCKSVVEYHDLKNDEFEYSTARMRARQQESLEKTKDSDFKLAKKEYKVALKKIPFIV